ncbi:MAG: hypothetical protein EP343_05475 [Deltaproteobacteria bacterium]|nr:MAG: hypothetical protein EP343_05475 [Deltaproteobacteria bacterium]
MHHGSFLSFLVSDHSVWSFACNTTPERSLGLHVLAGCSGYSIVADVGKVYRSSLCDTTMSMVLPLDRGSPKLSVQRSIQLCLKTKGMRLLRESEQRLCIPNTVRFRMVVLPRKFTLVMSVVMSLLLGGTGEANAETSDSSCSCSKEWIQTFRGNAHRRFYGKGYIPAQLKVRWRFKTSGFRDRRWIGSDGKKLMWHGTGWSGQAAVVGDRVWVSSVGGYLHCLNRHTGKQYWKFWAGGSIKSSVAYWNGRIYFGARSDRLFCLDAKTGKVLWKYHTPRKDVDSTPIIWKNKMYWGGEDGRLYAMNPLNGKIFWTYKTMGSIESSPTIVGNHIFINSYDGYLHSLDLKTGKLRWRFRTGDDTDTTPTYYKGKLFFGSENGWLYAVDADTGELLWKRVTDGGIWSTTAVVNDRVYVGSNDRRFYAIDANTGRLIWKRIIQEGIWASPVWVGGRILFGDWAGYIYVLRASDGEKLSSYKAGAYIVSTAAVAGGRVYLGSRDGYFYCFEGPKTSKIRRRRRRWAVYTPDNQWTRSSQPSPTAPSLSSEQKASWQRLVKALRSPNVYDRVLLARLLLKAKRPTAADKALLQVLLHDPAGNVRMLAVKAARRYGAVGASVATKALSDPEHRVRVVACRSLAALRWKAAAKAIRSQLWSRSPYVQLACGQALHALGYKKQSQQALRRLVWGGLYGSRRSGSVRGCPSKIAKRFYYREEKGRKRIRRYPRHKRPLIWALVALANQGDRCAQRSLLSRWFGCRNKLGREKAGYCSIFRDWQGWVKRIAPTLPYRFLSTKRQLSLLRRYGLAFYYDKNLRVGGLNTLATFDHKQRFPLFLKHARRDRYPIARMIALRHLRLLRKHEDFPRRKVLRIARRLVQKDRNPDVRIAAARLLGALGGKISKNALLRGLKKTRNSRVRAGILRSLPKSELGSHVAELKTLLGNSSADARCHAIYGLARVDAGISGVKQGLQSSDRFLQRCAVQALLRYTTPTGSWKALHQMARQHNSSTVSIRAAFVHLR